MHEHDCAVKIKCTVLILLYSFNIVVQFNIVYSFNIVECKSTKPQCNMTYIALAVALIYVIGGLQSKLLFFYSYNYYTNNKGNDFMHSN